MNENQTPVILTVIGVAAILLIAGLFMTASINSNLTALASGIEMPDVPTAEAIGAAVLAGITMPEMPEFPEYDTEKVDELWDEVYSSKITSLENKAETKAEKQFLKDNKGFKGNLSYFFEDDEVFDLLVDEYEDDYEGVWKVEYIKEYDDREVEVINLGLDDEDDREIELSTVIRVKVFTDEDDDTEYEFDKVYVDSIVTSDDEKLEAEVTYSLI